MKLNKVFDPIVKLHNFLVCRIRVVIKAHFGPVMFDDLATQRDANFDIDNKLRHFANVDESDRYVWP